MKSSVEKILHSAITEMTRDLGVVVTGAFVYLFATRSFWHIG